MNKNLFLVILAALIGLSFSNPVFAGKSDASIEIKKLKPVQLIQQQQDAELKNVLYKYLKFSNEHNFEGLKSLYAPSFISGDGLKRDQVLALIKESWANCPNIKYTSEVKKIRLNDNFATVESYDTAYARTVKKSELTNDTGNIESSSTTITYFQKFGKTWKITSDAAINETTAIKYGSAKKLNFKFFAPEQVYAGEDYTASLYANTCDGQFAFASITKEPIVYPQVESKEVFRQIDPDSKLLERVLKSNTTNNNELVSASVGITEISGSIYSNPKIKLTGLAVLFQRVNVIPQSKYKAPKSKEPIKENFTNDKLQDEK